MTVKRTAGERLDRAIQTTRTGLKQSEEYVKKKLKRVTQTEHETLGAAGPASSKRTYVSIVVGVLLLILLIWLVWPSGGSEKATLAQAQDIAKMLKAENVTIQGVTVTPTGYEVTYAAENAVDRFDDALLYDWATIDAVAADHDCDTVSIITTLDGQPVEKQTATCPSVRALARGVLTEQEFWSLVKHESSP